MRPSNITIWISSFWVILGLLVAFFPQLKFFWEVFGIGFIIVLLIDALATFQKPDITISHQINHNLPIYGWSNIKQVIRNQSSGNLHSTRP